MMTSEDVLAVMEALSAADCRAWLDGGWAVDAIIGEETRKHDDLDLVGELDAVEAVRQALAPLGYRLETDQRPVRVSSLEQAVAALTFTRLSLIGEAGAFSRSRVAGRYAILPKASAGRAESLAGCCRV